MAEINSLLALETSCGDNFLPINLLDKRDKERVDMPVKYIKVKSSLIESSYLLKRGRALGLYEPFLSRGTVIFVSPTDFMQNLRS